MVVISCAKQQGQHYCVEIENYANGSIQFGTQLWSSPANTSFYWTFNLSDISKLKTLK